uniref:flagellar basal-body rod protein FlgF n=1 Tax=Polynucleobacter sp. TaxID=2029855 RepID=UPI004047E0FF
MDKLIYTALTGAKQVMDQQATVANNLANVSTAGFRAQIDSYQAVPIVGDGELKTRTQVVSGNTSSDYSYGPIQRTGRDLDIAISGPGWFAVIDKEGKEAYTRNGSMMATSTGLLQTQRGFNLMGEGGPITVPPDSTINIAKDGSISTIVPGSNPAINNELGRLKLVNPAVETLVRGDDGLFRTKDGNPAAIDQTVTVVDSSIEGSNVNVVDAMVRMIHLSHQYEMQINLLKNAENNAAKASQLFNLS